jgi:hypothetical protein
MIERYLSSFGWKMKEEAPEGVNKSHMQRSRRSSGGRLTKLVKRQQNKKDCHQHHSAGFSSDDSRYSDESRRLTTPNILEDEEVRTGIPSHFPTPPSTIDGYSHLRLTSSEMNTGSFSDGPLKARLQLMTALLNCS